MCDQEKYLLQQKSNLINYCLSNKGLILFEEDYKQKYRKIGKKESELKLKLDQDLMKAARLIYSQSKKAKPSDKNFV